MGRYLAKQLLMIIPTLLVVIFIIFFILNIAPGDTARILLGANAKPEAIAALNERLGLDKPLLVRFFNYLVGIIHLDFGESYRTGEPVFDVIMTKFPVTCRLAILAVIGSALLGIPLGIISAIKEYSAIDYTLTVSSLMLASMPTFLLALLLILLFSVWLGMLPSSGAGDLKHYILPLVTLILPNGAYLSRMTRTSMLEVMREDYVRTAKAKGANEKRVIRYHAMKPTLMPIITLLGMTFAGLLGGALITELCFGLPGIGDLILTAVRNKDAPLILGSSIFLIVVYKVIMLIVDFIQAFIDPRLKSQFK